MTVFEEGGYVRYHNTQYIESNQQPASPEPESIGNILPEKVQGKHIKEQMSIIHMDQSRSNKSPVFPMMLHLVGVEDPFFINIPSIPGEKTGGDGDYDNAQGRIKCHRSLLVR